MTSIVKSLGCLSLWIILLGLESPGAAESSSGWKAGVARVDTTPTKPVRMAGYASRTSPSQGVAHPLAQEFADVFNLGGGKQAKRDLGSRAVEGSP